MMIKQIRLMLRELYKTIVVVFQLEKEFHIELSFKLLIRMILKINNINLQKNSLK